MFTKNRNNIRVWSLWCKTSYVCIITSLQSVLLVTFQIRPTRLLDINPVMSITKFHASTSVLLMDDFSEQLKMFGDTVLRPTSGGLNINESTPKTITASTKGKQRTSQGPTWFSSMCGGFAQQMMTKTNVTSRDVNATAPTSWWRHGNAPQITVPWDVTLHWRIGP